jgi:hypothetical protein
MTTDKEHLQWIHKRIVEVYRENRDIDFLIRLREIIDTQDTELNLHSVSYFAEQTKNVLTNKFCNIAKEHVGETFDKVPEATEILNAIDVINRHCS